LIFEYLFPYIVSEHSQTLWSGMNFTARQNEIIHTAIELIAESGIQQLTIKNLSKRIGIAESAIYRHFSSKLDILLGILDLFKENKEEMLRRVQVMSKSPLEQMRLLFEERFKSFNSQPAIAAVIFSEEIFRNDRRLSEKVFQIMQTNQQILLEVIRNGQAVEEFRKDIAADQMAFIIIGALRLIVSKWHLSDYAFDLQAEGKKLWDSIEKMVKP